MAKRGSRSMVVVPLALGLLLTGCLDARPSDDLGDTWISGPSTEGVSWLSWSPDSSTLYWAVETNEQTLYAATRGSQTAHALATGVSYFPSPTVTADGSAIFYTTYDAASETSVLFEAMIAAGGTSLASTLTVASDLGAYLAAPDGTRVALVDYGTGATTIRALAAGTSIDVGRFIEPTAFSPDGAALLARNESANDDATHYLVVDAATGASAPLSFPTGRSIEWVASWVNGRPRVVISNDQAIDLETNETTSLSGIVWLNALVTTPAHTFAYGWGDIDCLDPYTNAETGDHACSAFYDRLSRDDVSSGARQVIASEVVDVDNNADSFAPSPDGNWLAVAAGSGLIVDDTRSGPSAIKLKRLSTP